jgi:cytoskeleton protein RodZ
VVRPAPATAPVVAPVAAAAPAAAPAGADATPPVRKKLPSTGIVVFKTTEPSWIEVTDARGVIQLSRVIEPGEPVGASGPLPLNVSVGRADVTEVQVRGKPFPLQPVTKQGVARFEVQ